jgi:probable rRNA maturation factor
MPKKHLRIIVRGAGLLPGVNIRELAFLTMREVILAEERRGILPIAAEGYELSLLLAGRGEIRKLNRDWRGFDRPTDVLSFPGFYAENGRFWGAGRGVKEGGSGEAGSGEAGATDGFPGGGPKTPFPSAHSPASYILGDVAVCVPILKKQARLYGHGEGREFAFLFTHSLLHLCGYDHENPDSDAFMRRRQTEILEKIGCGIGK